MDVIIVRVGLVEGVRGLCRNRRDHRMLRI